MSSLPPVRDAVPTPAGEFNDPRRTLLEQALGTQYEILRQIGEGGAGTVFLARERLLERLVAIKVLRSEVVTADARERFVREARTAAKLMHAHVVPLYSFGQVGDTLYYIMGFVEGESLEAMLRRAGRTDSAETRRILVEVADALDYAHRNGVVHRDVKPDNILIERDSRRAILTDFGIAKVHALQSTLTRTGVVVGTPHYMSPEQASGDPLVDGRSDLYSLGVIGYRMLAGRLPFEGSSVQEVLVKHVTQEPASLVNVAPQAPPDLAWAIMRSLDKDPGRRWPTVEAFRQALETADDSAPELPEPLERLAGRAHRVLAIAWATIVVGALAAAARDQIWFMIAGGAVALAAVAWLASDFVSARQLGMSRARAWRLLGTPPERWAGWWPARLRPSGDVWTQLPATVRHYRLVRTLVQGIGIGIALPALLILAATRAQAGQSYASAVSVAAIAAVVAAALLVGYRSTAVRDLQSRNVQRRLMNRWLTEPTWSSGFWRRSENAALLTEAPTPQLSIDTVDGEQYCASTPTQSELPHGMFDHVDPRSPTPLYAQIASRLRVAIASGELKSGDGLPSVRQLATKLRINPATVVQAYRELEVEGLVTTRHGAGTFVQEVAADRRHRDRVQEARRLVRAMLADAAGIGITAPELRAAMEQELTVKPSGDTSAGEARR
jgi:DNA-binding transcriptional regulator YhcF (GntR family)